MKKSVSPRLRTSAAATLIVLIAGVAGAPSAHAAPPNDTIASATPLSGLVGTVTGTTMLATDTGDPAMPCGSAFGGRVFWRSTIPAGDNGQIINIDTAGSNFDTVLAVFKQEPGGGLSNVICNDDGGGLGLRSAASFVATGGATYLYAVAPFSSSPPGYVRLNYDLGAPVFRGTETRTTTVGQSSMIAGCSPGAPDRWLRLVGAGTAVTIDTFGSNYDTVLSVRQFPTGAHLVCNDDTPSEGSTLQSRVQFSAVAGQRYYVGVSGFSNATGNLRLTTTGATPSTVAQPTPPLPPSPAQNLLGSTAGDGSVSLSWTPPGNNGGTPVTNYQVLRGPAVIATLPVSTTSYVDTARPAGTQAYQVRAVNDAGFAPLSNTYTSAISAVNTSVNGPSGIIEVPDATLLFSATDPNATFECSFDGAPATACSSPVSLTSMTSGPHTFAVFATANGESDPSPATASWRVAPSTDLVTAPASPSRDRSPSFAFSSNQPGATFTCSLDGAAAAACTSPAQFPGLADGVHTIVVTAVDNSVSDPTPLSLSYEVDTTAPDTSITSSPVSPTNDTSAEVAFDSTESGSAFECSVDGSASAPCTSPLSLTGLAEGGHSVAVISTDALLNTDASPALAEWTIDLTAPDTALSAPGGRTSDRSPTIELGADELGATFACSLDGATPAPCSSPLELAALSDGPHTLSVVATDEAGNSDQSPATARWTVDTVAPDTTIVSGPAASTTDSDATFAVLSEDGATLQCSLDGAAATTCTSPVTYTSLSSGDHVFRVFATDDVGNTDASPAGYAWTITAPDTTIDSAPSGTVNSSSATVTFSSTDLAATFVCSLDAAAFAPCASPLALELTDGPHTLLVAALNGAGERDETPAQASWTVDTIPAETILMSGPSSTTASNSAVVRFTSEAGATFTCSVDGAAATPCTSPFSLSALSDGPHTLAIQATDSVGNSDSTPAIVSWTVDTVGPVVTFTAAPSGTVHSRSASFSWSTSEAASSECSLDGATYAPCSSPTTLSDLAVGSHTFAVRGTDAVGNVGPTVSRSWVVQLVSDVGVFVAGAPSSAKGGTTVTYTVTVRNAGPDTAETVHLDDVLPSQSAFRSYSVSQGTCLVPPVGSTGTLSCELGNLANGAQAVLQVTVALPKKAGTVSNTATVRSATDDPRTANNSATQTTTMK